MSFDEELKDIKKLDLNSMKLESLNQTKIKFKNKNLSDNASCGLLSSKPLISLLFIYSLEKISGLLLIEKKNIKYEIFFNKGKIAFITSNLENLSVKKYLENKNISIEEKEYHSDSQYISLLISKNKISPDEGFSILKKLVLKRLTELFNTGNGRFVFMKDKSYDINLNIDTIKNLWNSYSNAVDEEKINKFVESVRNNIIIKNDFNFKHINLIKLAPLESKFVNKIDNKVTCNDFIKALKNEKEYIKRFKRVIFFLFKINFVLEGELKDLRNIDQEIKNYQNKVNFMEEKANLFEIFNLNTEASFNDIKNKYFELSRKYHPDKLSQENNLELRKLKNTMYTIISTAFSKISSPIKLQKYRESLKFSGSSPEMYFKSEELFIKARKSITVGKYSQAKNIIAQAINIVDNEEYRIHEKYIDFILTWKNDSKKAENLLQDLEELSQKVPNYIEGHRFLARIYKLQGKIELSQKSWQKILKLAPYDSEAKREVR